LLSALRPFLPGNQRRFRRHGEFRDLRQKLNWTYHQIEIEELNPEGGSPERILQLRQVSRRYEDALVKAFSQVQSVDREFASLQSAKTVSVEELQRLLLRFSAAGILHRQESLLCVPGLP